jgi:hypothetical protein
MSKDQEGNSFSGYNFKDSMDRYRDKQHAEDVERQVQNDKVRKSQEDKRKAQEDTRNVDEEAEHVQSITDKMTAMLAKKKSDRAASKDTKDRTTPKDVNGTSTKLEYMRACLCRI